MRLGEHGTFNEFQDEYAEDRVILPFRRSRRYTG